MYLTKLCPLAHLSDALKRDKRHSQEYNLKNYQLVYKFIKHCAFLDFIAKMTKISENQIFNEILQTEEFQRLKRINQLGIMCKVHPTVRHSRFEHSIGVYERANWLLKILEKNSNLKINDFHKMCVKFAGLLHDVGHGPYSHFWENVMHHCDKKEYTHEEVGALVVEKLFQKVKLSNDPIEHAYGVALIQRLIVGNKENFQWGNGAREEFIFDIINNKTSAIDVDRLDYLNRDWKACKKFLASKPEIDIKEQLDNVEQLFKGARISPNKKCIQFNGNHIKFINSMFGLRETFHKYIYQQLNVRILEDIFLKLLTLRRHEEIVLPAFLVFDDVRQYVDIICQNSINDDLVEKWISNSSNQEVQKYLKAFNDLNFVIISNEPKDGFECIKIEYKYNLPLSIKHCLYGNKPMVGLKMEYSFHDKVFYSLKSEQ